MRGTKAKQLRKRARAMVIAMGKKPMEGYNTYDQAQNCWAMVPAFDSDGKRITDDDGFPLLKPEKRPGTIRCAWHWRVVYQWLKRNV